MSGLSRRATGPFAAGRISNLSIFQRFFGSSNDRKVKAMSARVAKINALEPKIQALSDEELAARRAAWTPRPTNYNSGVLWKYAQTVGNARGGAVTHPGAAAETHVYADI